MKCLPRPKDQKYVSLDCRAREREEESSGDCQEDGKVDVSGLVFLNDFRKVFVDVEEERRRDMSRSEK